MTLPHLFEVACLGIVSKQKAAFCFGNEWELAQCPSLAIA
jgi:hypothetical protein